MELDFDTVQGFLKRQGEKWVARQNKIMPLEEELEKLHRKRADLYKSYSHNLPLDAYKGVGGQTPQNYYPEPDTKALDEKINRIEEEIIKIREGKL